MNLFHVIDEVCCITCFRGVYRQAAVYRRGKDIYAKHGGGFIKLLSGYGTTAPSVSWLDIDNHQDVAYDRGALTTPHYCGR